MLFLDKKILEPLFQASEMSVKEAHLFRQELAKLIFSQAMLAVFVAMPRDKAQRLLVKLNQSADDQKKLKILQEGIKDSSQAKKALQSYLEEELPKLIKELAITFAENTTPEKKKKFLRLFSQT